MFQYLHWPKDWGNEIALQLKRAQYQAQLITDAISFDQLEAELFRFQNRGGHIDLIICLYAWEKNLKRINALKRISNAGGVLGIITLSEWVQPPGNSAIIDKSRLISALPLELRENTGEMIFLQEKTWKNWLERSEKLLPSDSPVQIHFQANPTFVQSGNTVKLYWEVLNADFVEIEPGIGPVANTGQTEIPVFEDTLFRLKANNAASLRSKSIFIKTSTQQHITLSIQVYDPESGGFIPLESTQEQHHVYAVFSGDKVRIDWEALPIGTFSETRMGTLPNIGTETVQIFGDEQFIFTLQTMQDNHVLRLQILAVSDLATQKNIPLGLDELSVKEPEIFPLDTQQHLNKRSVWSWLIRLLKWLRWK